MTTSGQEAGGGAPWTVSDTKNLKIQGELAGGALVAKASGRVDGGNAKDFQEALETMLKDNVNTFVLNMEDLSYISSAGLRVILLVAKQMQASRQSLGCAPSLPPLARCSRSAGSTRSSRLMQPKPRLYLPSEPSLAAVPQHWMPQRTGGPCKTY